jgi:hypothetical protein
VCSASSNTCAVPTSTQANPGCAALWYGTQASPSRMKATVRAMQLQPVPQVRAIQVYCWAARDKKSNPKETRGVQEAALQLGGSCQCGGFGVAVSC